MPITSNELREKYIQFFTNKGHAEIVSGSLIPENDPSVLFTTAGMHPLVPYLLGQKHPAGARLVDFQKCIRTGDIDDVGDNRHLTFFEMLGNWSLGYEEIRNPKSEILNKSEISNSEIPNFNQPYWKAEAIAWSFEFLTSKDWLGLDPEMIYVTVFRGGDDVAADEDSIAAWKEQFAKVGIKSEVALSGNWENENTRIFALGKDDNWWGLATGGPCGPCSEMFYDTAPEKVFEVGKSHDQLVKDFRLIEIWNDVFMEFNKQADGALIKSQQRNVDTGMGLERTTAVLNGQKEVFEIAEFQKIFERINELSGRPYADHQKEFRIIADHIRAATFILGDPKALEPSNVGAGYILRRLIRRAVRYAKQIGIKDDFTGRIAELVIDLFSPTYPELEVNRVFIIGELTKEEKKFADTLEKGLREMEKMAVDKNISGTEAFVLFSTYGFPFEMTEELAREKGVVVNKAEFDEEFKKHQELSRTASAGMFKGGLADSSIETTRLHTAAHLMLEAMRRVLGNHVEQRGSNITQERLRFDFTHPEKVDDAELREIESIVNEQIAKKLPVHFEEMSVDEATAKGATGVFAHKYGDKVKVYFVGNDNDYFSKEICGGPHVDNTSELGKFRIQKEESSSSGVRRVKAVLE